ncbi:hypothetical protein EAF04_002186 [Stromatinia cepivora]|nr:hypothetical protein EAF04_002186 [Stromatinia cepivora]
MSSPSEQPVYDKILVDIIQYVYHTTIPSSRAYERARIALLDALGCAIETLSMSTECRAMLGPTVPGTIVPNGFHLPGTSYILDPLKGAFDMGSLIRYLDHNDAYPGAEWGHPSDNLGALLAVADWQSRARSENSITLHTLLTAQIKAYEIQGVLQVANAFNKHGLDHTILVKVASTALTSYLLKLTEQQALAALSQAWQDGHPLRTFRQAPNAGPRKGWAAGDACMRAVHLNLLTMAGQPGAPSVLTAPEWGFRHAIMQGKDLIVARPYKSWVMESVFFKLIPAEGHAISAAEAALAISQQLRLRGLSADEDVKTVHIRTQKAAMTIVNKRGKLLNAADRDHCLQYIIAVILLKGSVIDTADYMDDSPWAQDTRVDNLREKMVVVEDEAFTRDYHDQKVRSGANAILVELGDGERLDEIVVEFPIGHPKRSDTLSLVKEKFRANMSNMFEKREVENILQAVESDTIPVNEFMDLFTR